MLPAYVDRGLTDFVEAARAALGTDLEAVVLYGSGAEGRMRPTSDVNVVIVLSEFRHQSVERLAPALVQARAAIRLEAMFLRESEIVSAAEFFPEKFADIQRRRRVLFGQDPFAFTGITREAALHRLRQVLLNLLLRTRQAYLTRLGQEDQLVLLVAETAGPLRACAAMLLELEGEPADSPKEALEKLVSSWREHSWERVLPLISEAREKRALAPGEAAPALFALMGMMDRMRARSEEIG